MRKKCVSKALVVVMFALFLCIYVRYESPVETHGETVYEMGTEWLSSVNEWIAETTTTPEEEDINQITDLTQAFDVILNNVTKEFIAGYAVDDSFLMWITAQYGEDFVVELAYNVLDEELNSEFWYENTGKSMHVLWLEYCEDSGFQKYLLENVYWQETADPSQVVISFTGDFNFAGDWCTMEYAAEQPGGVRDCFSEELLQQMRASDIMIMNNEFIYMKESKSAPLAGKAYTFRANPEDVALLEGFGADAVTLANNHVYDYGKTGLLDTMYYLEESGIPYVGAGADIDEASKILCYVANGRKIAIVSASQIEKSLQYTREATANTPGVLKTLNPDKFLRVIELADKTSDYVIAVPHWGTEGTLYPDNSQRELSELFVQAGADAIIGGHPHRLQGVGYVQNVPVAYSLGNFWFSEGTLYTTVAQIIIAEDGTLQMRFLPCEQREMVTSLLMEQEEKDEFYQYLAAISMDVGIDADGNIYDKGSETYTDKAIIYDSETSNTDVIGMADNDGRRIDIVGNLR